jgi:hypothetical protein
LSHLAGNHSFLQDLYSFQELFLNRPSSEDLKLSSRKKDQRFSQDMRCMCNLEETFHSDISKAFNFRNLPAINRFDHSVAVRSSLTLMYLHRFQTFHIFPGVHRLHKLHRFHRLHRLHRLHTLHRLHRLHRRYGLHRLHRLDRLDRLPGPTQPPFTTKSVSKMKRKLKPRCSHQMKIHKEVKLKVAPGVIVVMSAVVCRGGNCYKVEHSDVDVKSLEEKKTC